MTGKVGTYARSFNGTQHFNVGMTFAYTTQNFSISMWVAPDAVQNNYATIVSNAYDTGGTARGWTLEQRFNYTNRYRFQTGNGSWGASENDFTIADGVWSHLVIVREGAEIRGYLNGQRVYTDTAKANIAAATNNTWIGNSENWPTNAWAGSLDEFAIWERALSPAEIANIYALQAGSYAGADASTLTFTPDLVGTYTVKLDAFPGVSSDNADAVIGAGGGGAAPSFQGDGFQGEGFGGDDFQGE